MGGYEKLIITRRITAGPSCLLAQLTSITGATHCFYSTIYIRKRIYTKDIYTIDIYTKGCRPIYVL